MDYTFATPAPVDLVIEVESGVLTVDAEDVTTSTVHVEGAVADETVVEFRGNTLSVTGPRSGFGFGFGRSRSLTVHVVVPTGSNVATKTGSADLSAEGVIGRLRSRSGSGDVSLNHATREAVIEIGSGTISVGTAASHLRIKSGSGDVSVGTAESTTGIVTGSGDIDIKQSTGPMTLKSGSGDLTVHEGGGELNLATASGDITIGKAVRGALTATSASGDICVCVPTGMPVWTDITTMTGRVRSTLASTGAPADGQPYVEVRATTVSGDVLLQNI
jgi:DUF4097 and DUF4098 domain-containing protein YvlB